jgi:hypothetical protein
MAHPASELIGTTDVDPARSNIEHMIEWLRSHARLGTESAIAERHGNAG